jgi:serine/threonine-protein kinase
MHTEPLESGRVIASRYRIEEILGAGTSATVYRGLRLSDGHGVAIKILRDEALAHAGLRRRFEREGAALAAMAHPNVIGVLELGEVREGPFLVMEHLRGCTLEKVLRHETLSIGLALDILDQLLAGLGFAHAHGVLHRDVKPENVFLAMRDDAAFCEVWGRQSGLTARGTIQGTPAYMAPEHVFGPDIDARSDVYAAGVLAHEMLTGRVPFEAPTLTELFQLHAVATVRPLREARPELESSPELEVVVQRALAKRPEHRFADASEMRAALASAFPQRRRR